MAEAIHEKIDYESVEKELKNDFGKYNPSLSIYFRDIAKTKPLSSQNEADLARKIKEGDVEARNKLVNENLRFVVSIAKGYHRGKGDEEDLISAGNLALITAAERFDETKGFKFISYAVWWVRQAMLNEIRQYSRTVRLPLNRVYEIIMLNRYTEEYMKSEEGKGGKPNFIDIAEEFDISVEKALKMFQNNQSEFSLDKVYEGNDGSPYDLIPDSSQEQPDEIILRNDLEKLVKETITTLDEREANVLKNYFGLEGLPELTLEEIGMKYGLTRERIRQIKGKAINKLRHPTRSKKLQEYYDGLA